ncbi:aminotransferase class I/II-fold pyridoxal phosphate-dependent enzyme, partial [Halobium palmae]
MFDAVPYIDWMTGRTAAAAHDLGSSDLRPIGEGGGVVPRRLADRSEPPEERPFADRIAELYGVGTENVLVTAGATHANFLATAAALQGGPGTDRVLVEKPGYQPLVETPKALGATVDRFVRTAATDYALDPDRVEAAVTNETALVTVTTRHNPSGGLADPASIDEAVDVASEVDATLLVDEVYAPFTPEP